MSRGERISVVIPAHDAEDTVAEAIRSALSQTVPPYEVLVVDDASTDGTAAVVAGLAEAHPVVRLHSLEVNGGVSRARNAGIALATGDWVALLDADDVWNADKTERQLELARQRPALAIIGAWFHEAFGDRLGAVRTEFWWPSALLVRREVFDEVRFDPMWRLSELPEFFSRFDELYTRDGVSESLLRYRMNSTGIAHRSFVTERRAWMLIGENRRRRAAGLEPIGFDRLDHWYRTSHGVGFRTARAVRWRGDRMLRSALIEVSQRRPARAAAYAAAGLLLSPASVLGRRGRLGSARRASRAD